MDPVLDPRTGKMVDPQTGLPVSGNYKPPARVGTLDQIFNGTGIPERATLMNDILNPTVALHDAGKASQTLFDPDTTGWGRVGAFGNMASNMAGVLAPAMAAKSIGGKPVDAIVEALTNYSAKPKMLADEFMADEFGGIKLYHGSPHDFDRFSMDKIGTGEGAQAYGHGLYFAESPDVARGYRDTLTANTLGGPEMKIKGLDVNAFYDRINDRASRLPIAQAQGEYDKLEMLELLMQDGDPSAVAARIAANPDDYPPAAFEWFQREIAPSFKRKGALYEVEVNANPDDFLDWDKPLSEQPAKVRDAFSSINAVTPDDAPRYARELQEGTMKGSAMWPNVEPIGSRDVGAMATKWREAGIPGIKYLDAGSRGAGDGSRNYVVFDENLIEIVKKYGIAGAAAMLGMSAADLEASMQPQSMRDVLQ